MPKFQFELESLLLKRRSQERDRRRELAAALKQRMDLQDQLRQMQNTIVESKQELGQGLVGTVDMDRVSGFARYSGQVTQRAHASVSQLAGIERRVEAARATLLEATRQRKALEKLREQRYTAWKRANERSEAERLDEIAIQQHIRRTPTRAAG